MEEQLDRMFQEYSGDRPGVAIRILVRGEPVLTRCYGLADMEKGIPVSARTSFRLASITKQFTATAVLMLVDENRLSLDTPLRNILPELPAWADSMVIRHVLNHTSGLPAYEDLMADTATVQVLDADVLALVAGADSAYFPPGSAYRYSNSGYALLSLVVERISGQSFPEYLQERIFYPLGMDSTLAYRKGLDRIPQRALGYHVHGDTVDFSDQSPTSAVLGDGGIYSSLDDMSQWDAALYDLPLLGTEIQKLWWTPGRGDYGFGWRIDTYHGHRRIHHTGGTCGFSNIYIRFPDDKISFILFSNRRTPGISAKAYDLVNLVFNHRVELHAGSGLGG